MTTIFTKAHVPDELVPAWFQHLRTFDVMYPGCRFEVMADAPDASLAEMIEAIKVDPSLTFTKIWERPKE